MTDSRDKPTATTTDDPKSDEAAKVVRHHMIATIAAGIIPIPVLGIGLLGGIQLRMLSQLAKLYDVEFKEQRANAIIGALAGVSVTTMAGSLLWMLPGVGQVLGVIGAFTLPPASTYALGHVFIDHFASGGTFMTFDPDRAKESYDKKVVEGHKEVEKSYVGIKP